MYVIIFTNLFIYYKFIFLADISHFPNQTIQLMCYYIWTIIHLDTHFLEFEFFDYDNVKPFKNKFSINSDLASKTYFWYDTKVHCMCLIIKWCPKPCQNATYEWNSKLLFLTYCQFIFSQCDQLANFAK
jgi:hypothetical protein